MRKVKQSAFINLLVANEHEDLKMEIVKACLYCQNCDYEPAITYSEYTSQGESVNCLKGHFSYKDMEEMSEGAMYEMALKCDDFGLKEEIKKYLSN